MPRRIGIVLVLLLMIGAAGFAQNSGDVFLGSSFNRASTGLSNTGNLNGGIAAVEGKIAPFAGLVGEAGTQWGTLQLPAERLIGVGTPGSVSASEQVVTYLFGGRLSPLKGKFQPFAQVLVGYAHLHESTPNGNLPPSETFPSPGVEFSYRENCFADAIGGGLDYRFHPRLAWRFKATYCRPASTAQPRMTQESQPDWSSISKRAF